MSSDSPKPFHREDVEGVCTIVVGYDQLVPETSDQLYTLAAEAIAGDTKQIVLNLANVPAIKSAAIAILLQLQKRVREAGGALKICRLHSEVFRLLQLTHSAELFDIHEKQRDAVAAFLGRSEPPSETAKSWRSWFSR